MEKNSKVSLFDHTNHEVYLVTSKWQERDWGCVVTWVLPLSLCGDNRWFVVALSPLGATFKAVSESQCLALQMLSTENLPYIALWGCESSKDVDKFSHVPCEESPQGPLLVSGTVGWTVGEVQRCYPSKERHLVVCRSLDSSLSSAHPAPTPLRTADLKENLPPEDLQRLKLRRYELHELSKGLSLID